MLWPMHLVSCLPQKSTPCEGSEYSFYALVECHNNEHNNTHKYDFHPLSYEYLETTQQRDPHLKKDLYIIPTSIKEFLGGGKIRSLICYNNKIVVPRQLQKHVIDWYHITLCHPGINRTETTTFILAQDEGSDHKLCANMLNLPRNQTSS
jgi:hypothetical protein